MGQCKTNINSITHPSLNQGTIVNKDNQQYMKFTLSAEDEELENWKRQLQDVGKLGKLYLLLPNHIQEQKQGFCGGGKYLMKVFYELFPSTLTHQIQERVSTINYYQELQLWYILYMIIQAGAFLEKKNFTLGNIHPNNIALSEDNRVRIISKFSSLQQIDQPLKQQFPSPQQLNYKGEKVNKNLSESYGIGLTILSAGILHICEDVYSSNSINREQLSEYLQIFGSKYSSYLYSTVHSLLQTNPFDRKTCSILKIKLQKYEDKILGKQGFLPEHQNKKKLNYKMSSHS